MSLMISNKDHPAESTHWYTKKGAPAYEVMSKTGNMRPTTLRDARVHKYIPSVSTIIKCAASPGLDRWKQEQVLLSALTLSRDPDEQEADYLKRVMKDSKEQGKKAAERGTAIHASIEGFYEGKGVGKHPEHVRGLENALHARFGAQEWMAEQTFAHPMGYGGKTDLSCPGILLDVKTKEFGPDKLPEAYDEHLMQLAAYRNGMGMAGARCANIFISVTNPGLVHVHPWEEEDMEKGLKMFCGLLDYWYAKTNLDRVRIAV